MSCPIAAMIRLRATAIPGVSASAAMNAASCWVSRNVRPVGRVSVQVVNSSCQSPTRSAARGTVSGAVAGAGLRCSRSSAGERGCQYFEIERQRQATGDLAMLQQVQGGGPVAGSDEGRARGVQGEEDALGAHRFRFQQQRVGLVLQQQREDFGFAAGSHHPPAEIRQAVENLDAQIAVCQRHQQQGIGRVSGHRVGASGQVGKGGKDPGTQARLFAPAEQRIRLEVPASRV